MVGDMNIIGIGGWDHDANAALLSSRGVLAIGEEERFCREKHKGQHYNASVMHCLNVGNSAAIDHIAIGFCDTAIAPQMINAVRCVRGLERVECSSVSHHKCHAAGAFYPSGFDRAVVLTIDGYGDNLCSTAVQMNGSTTTELWSVPYPHSLGGLWMSTSFLLGFGMRDAGKVMGLASYGVPRYQNLLLDQVILHSDGSYEFDLGKNEPDNFLNSQSSIFLRVLHECRTSTMPITQVHMDIAASLQFATEVIVMHAVAATHARTSCESICLSGGVALNSTLNGKILRESPFENVFVPPNPGDGGTGSGSAMHWAAVAGVAFTNPQMSNPYLGAEFSQDQIETALLSEGLAFSRPANIEDDVARHIAQGKIVGWFQGRAEVGPRALGNRSILADPRRPDMKEILNKRVKFREWFRPFAPAVIDDKQSEWFDTEYESRYMSFVCAVLPCKRNEIPAVTHIDGTARIQTVRYEHNPRFYRVIKAFEGLTDVPLVINTSFNTMGEPIVNSPHDAIRCFLRSGMDVLAIGDAIIVKET
jgi:carbamoyltransferase